MTEWVGKLAWSTLAQPRDRQQSLGKTAASAALSPRPRSMHAILGLVRNAIQVLKQAMTNFLVDETNINVV